MSTLNAIQTLRVERDGANKQQARDALALAVAALAEGQSRAKALKHLNYSQRKKLASYAGRESLDSEQVLRAIGAHPNKLDEVAEAVYTHAARQSDGERNFHEDLSKTVMEQSCVYDSNGSLVHKLPGGFLNCGWKGAHWKGLDFLVSSFGVAELFAHKCNNGQGGAQTLSQQELMRLVQRASPYEEGAPEYDDPADHRPEAIEIFFREGVANFTRAPVQAVIVAAIQDGNGRTSDLEALRLMAQPSLYAGSPLLVFGGTREEYWRVRPLMFILTRGWDAFTPAQQEELAVYVAEFAQTYPDGFHGFYGNPHAPWEVLEPVSQIEVDDALATVA